MQQKKYENFEQCRNALKFNSREREDEWILESKQFPWWGQKRQIYLIWIWVNEWIEARHAHKELHASINSCWHSNSQLQTMEAANFFCSDSLQIDAIHSNITLTHTHTSRTFHTLLVPCLHSQPHSVFCLLRLILSFQFHFTILNEKSFKIR